MEQKITKEQELGARQRYAGYSAFFISGICAISSGIVVSLLQEQLGFAYGMTGTLLSLMNIGNLLAGFATGLLSGKIGLKRTAAVLTAGYAIGYFMMSAAASVMLLMPAFFLAGVGRGSTINNCTVLVSNNSEDRTKSMNLLHGIYALGALLCPILISIAAGTAPKLPMVLLACCGTASWLIFVCTPMEGGAKEKRKGTDWSFLKKKKFYVLTGLLFCQNAVEISVTGWLVTYFKGSGLLSGTLSAYTVTVMWLATLVIRFLIAFVIPIRRSGSAMIKMSLGCVVFYLGLVMARGQISAIILLFAFSFAMGGMNPTAVASAGRMSSAASVGIMLPAASGGAILMPWVIGAVAERAGIVAGMACNLAPCMGMLILSAVVKKMQEKEEQSEAS